jgi:hypothetical protein
MGEVSESLCLWDLFAMEVYRASYLAVPMHGRKIGYYCAGLELAAVTRAYTNFLKQLNMHTRN